MNQNTTPEHCPMNPYKSRNGSCYRLIFDLLWNARHEPILKSDLIAEVMKITGKAEYLVRYSVHIVCTPNEDGTGHSRAHSDKYFVKRFYNGMVQLFLKESASSQVAA